MKTDVRVDCAGAKIGELVVPEFQLSRGEIACLHVPPYHPQAHSLAATLSNLPSPSGWRLAGRAVLAVRPMPARGVLRWNRNPPIKTWLESHAHLKPADVRQILAEHELDENCRVAALSHGDRSVVAMEIAVRLRPVVVVFDNAGCSQETVDRMIAVLSPRLADLAAVLVSSPSSPPRVCPPGVRCLELQSIYGHRLRQSA